MTGRARQEEATQFLALITRLIALTESVATLRGAQGRAAQAAASRHAAEHLRTIAPQPTAGVVASTRTERRPRPRLGAGRTRA